MVLRIVWPHGRGRVSHTKQGALPGGCAGVPFACGVMALASLLAAQPRVTLEVWHKER